ncbi:MAG: sulfur carrier protein ThiS [Parvibaculum sp.]
MISLFINGESHTFPAPLSVPGLIGHLGFDPAKIAIELNLEIVPRSAYASTMLKDGDRLEIVNFVGGG